jgi:hypothetical protein
MDPRLAAIEPTLREISFPLKFAVEVCADCNLECTMCHHPEMRRPKGKMPFELWKRCATQIAEQSPATECWFSFCGEPLLEPDLLFRMLEYGQDVGLQSLNINTNGMLMTPEIADRILDSPARLVVIGIDGFRKESYEALRKGGDRDTVYANVEYLLAARDGRDAGPEVQVQFIEMDENDGDLPAFQEHWMPRGATLKVRNKLSWGGKFETPVQVDPEQRIPCPWALTMMHVFWDGRVPRCPGDTEGEEGVGNAWDEPLHVLWKRLGKYREDHLARRFERLPERCQTCKDWMTGAAQRIRPTAATAPEA